MGMDLLQTIRTDRVRQRRKQPCGREVFNTVSSIVKGYGLGENFLKTIDSIGDYPAQQKMDLTEVKTKKVFEFPPFSLVSQDQYRLVMAIAGKLDNPYLPFAHSPQEMLLSAPLYAANPALTPEDLRRYDFATLLLCQRAKEELANLEKQSGSGNGTLSQGRELQAFGDEGTHTNVLQDRIQQLAIFIAKVETMEPPPE